MSNASVWLSVVSLLLPSQPAQAEEPKQDPLRNLWISPDVLMRHREKLELTEKQVQGIRERVEELGPKVKQYQQHLQKAKSELMKSLAADPIEERSALQHMERVLDLEKELKQLQLRLVIQIRNDLTPKQRKLVSALPKTEQQPDDQQRLRKKLQQVQQEVQRLARDGQPPVDVIELMQRFPELMRKGNAKEAEALLDRALKLLGSEEPEPEDPADKPSVRIDNPLSFEQVQTRAGELKKHDVAWRKIEWKTCLLDGLKASREQGKPILLWIFIDRPIDDERC